MKKILKRTVFLALYSIVAVTTATAQSFTISGTIDSDVEGFENGLILLFEFDNENSIISQQTTIVDGKFSFTGTTPYPKKLGLYNIPIDKGIQEKDYAWLMLENTDYQVHISKDNYQVESNSSEQIRFAQFEHLYRTYQLQLTELTDEIKSRMDSCQTEEDKNEVLIYARNKDFSISSEYENQRMEWLERNLDSYVGLERFYFGYMRNIRKRQAEDLFAKIPENLSDTEHYKRLKLWLDNRNNLKVGKPLHPAVVYDIYGNEWPVLQAGKKQVIFFGVRDTYFYKPFEKLTAVYEKYKDKDIYWTVIAQGERNDWVRYLSQDTLPYPVFLSDDDSKLGIFNQYDIHAFPQVIILDSDHNILLKESFHQIKWDEVLNQL